MSRLESLIVEQARIALEELRDACANTAIQNSFIKTATDLGIEADTVANAEKTRLQAEISALTSLGQIANNGMSSETTFLLRQIRNDCDALLLNECSANDDGDGTQMSWLPIDVTLKTA